MTTKKSPDELTSRDKDQFYTNPLVAELLFGGKSRKEFPIPNSSEVYVMVDPTALSGDDDRFTTVPDLILEPSAGVGAISRLIPSDKRVALDLDPQNGSPSYITKMDFFDFSPIEGKRYGVWMNPPFGNRSKLAIDFFNKCARFCDYIAIIAPNSFDKFSVQKHLNQNFFLLESIPLPRNSFVFNGKPYNVNCVFQTWVRTSVANDYGNYIEENTGMFRYDVVNLRKYSNGTISHSDFDMFLYNNVPAALKFFDKTKYNWDFGVPRQGYQDYSRRVTNPDEMEKNKQWLMFMSSSDTVRDRLMSMDFDALSKLNTAIPGFGKSDVISKYVSMYGH